MRDFTRLCITNTCMYIYHTTEAFIYIYIPHVYSGLSIPWGCSKPLYDVMIHNTCKWGQKRWDFRLLLKEIKVFDCLISRGRALQREGVASLNDLLP